MSRLFRIFCRQDRLASRCRTQIHNKVSRLYFCCFYRQGRRSILYSEFSFGKSGQLADVFQIFRQIYIGKFLMCA